MYKDLLLSPFPYTMQDKNHLYGTHILLCASSDLEMTKRMQNDNSSTASFCRMDTGTHWGEVKTPDHMENQGGSLWKAGRDTS